jgi:methionyl-tRNA synthetase
VDGFRYHFLADLAFGNDGDFSYEGMVARYNADLANNLGNLVARVATVTTSKCGGVGPAPRADSPLAEAAAKAVTGAAEGWAAVQPADALSATWGLIRATNAYLEANEPWRDALEALRIVAILICPAMPTTAQIVWKRIGMTGAVHDQRVPADVAWGAYPGGTAVTKGDPLFPRKK